MTAARRTRSNGLFLWLALALAGVHALVPLGSPLARASGSAFSAFTSDVALGPSRRSSPRNEAAAADGAEDRASIFVADPLATLHAAAEPRDPRRPDAAARAAASTPARAAHLPVGYLSRAPPRLILPAS